MWNPGLMIRVFLSFQSSFFFPTNRQPRVSTSDHWCNAQQDLPRTAQRMAQQTSQDQGQVCQGTCTMRWPFLFLWKKGVPLSHGDDHSWVNFRIHSWKVRIVRLWSSKAPSQLRFWGMGTRPKRMRIGFHCNMKEPQYGPQNEEINYIPPVFSKVFSILGWMRFIFVAILASAKYRGTCFSYFSRAENIDFKDGKLGTRSKQQLPKKLIWGSFGCHEIQESRHHEPVSYQHNCITGIMSIQSIMLGKLKYFTWKVRRGNDSPKSMHDSNEVTTWGCYNLPRNRGIPH